uniref:KH_dom_type_1 domain-containing protein n=1 Tax=Parastrongyloides trichosuri TaxID=131310 RepID=A0A0N4ZKP5_PARTI
MTKIVLPGDFIKNIENSSSPSIIGRGLKVDKTEIISTHAGILCTGKDGIYIDIDSKRYQPTINDFVVGVVTNVMVENIKLEICSLDHAVLSSLAFEGATKRNRPNVKIGDVIYARVISTSKYLETELACIDKDNFARGLGVLPYGGMVFRISLHHARRLLSPKCCLLNVIGKEIKYESCIGMNGRCWIKSDTLEQIKHIMRIIQQAEMIPESELEAFVYKELASLKGICKKEL